MIALVAGGTRGGSRGIAVALGATGATVYVTGRSSRTTGRSAMDRPETIEETAEQVTAAGGTGIPLFYDLAKASVIRLALAQAEELRPHGVAAVALTPGFLRSEAVLDHFGVTADTWRDAGAEDPHFLQSETPAYLGRAVAALAGDPDVLRWTGQALTTWGLAQEYGFTDVDGSRPAWGRYFQEVVIGGGRADGSYR